MENIIDSEKTKKLKHVQVYDQLYRKIQEGTYSPGSQLPSEPDLAEQLNVSRMTLRRALALLHEDRLVNNIRGKGNFICETGSAPAYRGMEQTQHPVYSCCLQKLDDVELEFRIEPPTEFITQTLKQTCAAVVITDRWYHQEGQALAYSLSFIPIEVISAFKIDLSKPEELKLFLEKNIYDRAVKSSCTLSYTNTGNFTAIKYILSKNAAFLLIQENLLDEEGQILVSTKHYIPVELFQMKFHTVAASSK